MSDKASLIHDLEQAFASGTPARRLVALTRITDLFLNGSGRHVDERIAAFEAEFLVLVHTIEVNARAQLQRRNWRMPATDMPVARCHSRVVPLVVGNAGAARRIPRYLFLKLLENAGAQARTLLVAIHPSLSEGVDRPVLEIRTAIADEIRKNSREHAEARSRIKRLCRTSQLRESDLHGFAVAQDFERSAVAMSMLRGYPIALVERALNETNPDLLLVLARAADFCRATARALLTMPSAGRGMSPADVDRTLTNFDNLQVTTARCALEFYRMRLRADDTAHAPGHLAMAWFVEALPERPRQVGA